MKRFDDFAASKKCWECYDLSLQRVGGAFFARTHTEDASAAFPGPLANFLNLFRE